MKKGDWVVCVHHRFANFTKGKKYQLISDSYGSTLDILNDKGERGRPSLNGYESGKAITYFMTIQDIREKKLNEILYDSRRYDNRK
jgi:hypothetical protein